jgi:hypothetical protein
MAARTNSHRFWNQVHARWKWTLSFRKKDWELADYPIEIREQEPDLAPRPSRLKLHRFVASIVNWHLSGSADTREDAIEDLRRNLKSAKAARKEDGEAVPRPGATVPISFASQERVNVHAEISEDFIHRVLGLPWAFISDESSLWDFHEDETNEALVAKIQEVYGVDVSDIATGRIWEIFERIKRVKPDDWP